jgi:membrane-associated phospholipid phosphatase
MKAFLLVLAFLGPLQAADDSVQAWVQQQRGPLLERPMRSLTDLGKPVVVFAGLLLVAAFDVSAGPATARLALAALVPTNLVVEGLKRLTGRTRPDGEHKRSNTSFPSSHAANAFALAWVLARRYRRWAAAPWVLAALVAVSRVYLNRHYASDVLVGSAIGVLCAWFAARTMAAWEARRHARSEI